MTAAAAIKKFNLPAMGQLGIVVPDIHRARRHYTALLNIHPWYRARIVDSQIHYQGRPIDLELDIVVGYSGRLQIELIQVIRGDANIYTDLIDSRGQGIHHIGFIVSGIDKRVEAFRRAGLDPVQHGTLATKGRAITRFAYFDTIDQFGYITELIQTTLGGINVGMSRGMMKLGRLLGDVDMIVAP